MWKRIAAVALIGFLAWAYQNMYPPPPKIPSSPGGPPVTEPRIKLRDGRHLAYNEYGVSKNTAKYKIVYVHGFNSHCYDTSIFLPELFEELKIYMVTFDRPGYGQSDPDPKRMIESFTLDIEDLADKMELGAKFYVVGFSMGGKGAWGSLKYIPHRLAGVALIAPVVNYLWPCFPANLSMEAYKLHYPQDQWGSSGCLLCPWLVYRWNTQNWFPGSSVVAGNSRLSAKDLEILSTFFQSEGFKFNIRFLEDYVRQQGIAESLIRDYRIGFGRWEFDPMEIENPFPKNEGGVHLWDGDER